MFKSLPLDADGVSGYGCIVDLVYSERETPLVRAARARSLPVLDGLALLVAQAELAFERFTGMRGPGRA